MTRASPGGGRERDSDAGDVVPVALAMLLTALMMLFLGGPVPGLLFAVGAYLSIVCVGLLLTLWLDGRYPS